MKEMVSGITTVPFNSSRALAEAGKRAAREKTSHIAPSISLEGVPGEYDFRKFLTPAFEGLVPVLNGSGDSIVNSLAVTTNKNEWQTSTSTFINGLFGPVPAPESSAAWYTDLSGVQEGDAPPVIATYDDKYPPSKAIATGQTTAQGISISLTQATDKRNY